MVRIPTSQAFEDFSEKTNIKNLFALLGAYTSIIHDEPIQLGEKDFRM